MSNLELRPGDVFRVKGQRGRWEVLEVRPGDVLAYGGSPQPWGRKGFRSFRLDAELQVVEEAQPVSEA